jgi:hypothetical protein
MFRVEFFNLLNSPKFWLPNTALNSVQFGQISQTADLPRVIQFSLKVMFYRMLAVDRPVANARGSAPATQVQAGVLPLVVESEPEKR